MLANRTHMLMGVGLWLVLCLAGATHANAFYFKKFPVCHEGKVLKKITKLFNKAEHMTWHRGIEMITISQPHGHGRFGFPDSAFNRRYCHAYAHLSNGRRHKVYYLIEEGMGLAGTGWNVEFCIPRYDPWRIYDAYCRTVRPR